jgi:hypothetical protein
MADRSIRPAEPGDAAAVRDLVRAAYASYVELRGGEGRGVWPAGGTALHQREDARELGRLRQAGLRGDRARTRRGLPARLHAQAASLMGLAASLLGLVANQPLALYLFIQRREVEFSEVQPRC